MSETFPDLEQLQLPDWLSAVAPAKPCETPWKAAKRNEVKGEFLKGPIPLTWLTQASTLPGKAPLSVALATWFEVGRRRSHEITLTTAICKRFGVNRKAKYRGLSSLEEAGLVSVQRQSRKNPIVTVLLQN